MTRTEGANVHRHYSLLLMGATAAAVIETATPTVVKAPIILMLVVCLSFDIVAMQPELN